MRKEIFFEKVIGFILIMMVVNFSILIGFINLSFEIGLAVFVSWFFPLIAILIWLVWVEEY